MAGAIFALSVLTQALAVAVLPVAGPLLAPSPLLGGLPYALTLLGAVAATLPGAILADASGRRMTMAVGGGLGVAGAGLAAWGVTTGHFGGLLLGSVWLGVAQGVGLAQRHAAGVRGPRAIAAMLGCGGLAAFVTPVLIATSEARAGPLAPGAILILVGLLQLIAIGVAACGPVGRLSRTGAPPVLEPSHTLRDPRFWRDPHFWAATLAGAAAWSGMAMTMSAAPSLMASCGQGPRAASGAIAWHILWMYAPAAALAVLDRPGSTVVSPRVLSGPRLAALGLVLIYGALALLPRMSLLGHAGPVMSFVGGGWSLATLGVSIAIHARGPLSSTALAAHDTALWAGAILGALAAPALRLAP